jgi:hypothetical protein
MEPKIILKSVSSTGKTKTVNVFSEHLKNVRAVKLTLMYDPKIVKPNVAKIKLQKGIGGMIASAIDKVYEGQLNLSWFAYPSEDFPHKKVWLKIPFTKVSSGVSELKFNDYITDFGCRLIIGISDYPDNENTYQGGTITFK